LRQLGLSRGFLTQIHTPQYPAGRIIAQYPSASTEVERNSAVGFLVSQGEKETTYLMPDLIGRKAEQVVPRLQTSGFKVEDIRHVYYPGLEKELSSDKIRRVVIQFKKEIPSIWRSAVKCI